MFGARLIRPIISAAPPGVFDPATLALTGWWRADDYDPSGGGEPVGPGVASAGPSGSRPLQDDTFAGAYEPTLGTGVHGHSYWNATADYFRWLDTEALVASDFFDADKVSIAVWGSYEDSDTNGANASLNRCIFGMYGGMGGFTLKNLLGTLTAQAFIYDAGAAYNTVNLATVTPGTSYFLQMSLYGGNLHARVNRGSWTVISSGNVAALTLYLCFCASGSGSAKTKMQEIFLAKGLPESDFDDLCDYIEDRYGVSL